MVAIVVAVVAITLVGVLLASTTHRPHDARRRRRPRARRRRGDRHRPRRRRDLGAGGPARGARGRPRRRSSRARFDPNFGFALLLPIFAAVVLGGIGSAYGALAGGLVLGRRDGALDLGGLRRRRRPGLQAGRRVRRPRRRPARSPAGAPRKGARRMSTLASGEFWAFVGVVAGIYTIFALGHPARVRLHRPAQLRPRRVHGDRRLRDGDPRREGGAGACGSRRRSPSSRRRRPASSWACRRVRLRADYFAIVTIAFSEIVRYVATNEDRLTGGTQGTINLSGRRRGRRLQRRVGALPRMVPGALSTSARRTSPCSCSSGRSPSS